MKKTFLITIFIVSYNLCFSQTKMSKKETLLEWNKIENLNKKRLEKEYGEQMKKLPFEAKVVDFIDSLKNNGIDTIGVFSQVSVGSYSTDSCDNDFSPWESFIHWIENGKVFQKEFREFCNFETIRIDYSTIISYYNNCKSELKKEKIYPVITKGERTKSGKPDIEFMMVDHTTHFTILCLEGNDSIQKNFTGYDLEAKEGMFYEENQNSRINSWTNLILNQLNE